ncbi:phenylacetate--CoA ligase family protein [Blastococcus sp. SYSU D00820]
MIEPQGDERYWNKPTQTAPREVLDALHLEKIRHLVGWAYEHSPLHRRIYDDAGIKPADIRTWDDYHHRLPFTDKPDYVADQDSQASGFGGVALGREHWQQYFHTTGTTGRFLNEVFTPYEMQKAGSQYCYSMWDQGLRPGDSMYFCFNWGPWIGLWTFYWGARNLNLQIMSGGGAGTAERIKDILELRPTAVVGTPTYLIHLAEAARSEGLDLREAGVRLLGGGGEAGLSIPATRRQLGELWGVGDRVLDAYGIGEALFIGQSCREWGGGVHVIEDVAHSYVVDPETGAPLTGPDDVGEHVVTSYTHFSQPFIKYRTHDLVRLDQQHDHGCGWTWGHMPGSVLGRADFMVTIRGVNVYPTAVEQLIGDVPGLTCHYELHISRQDGFDRMQVQVEAAPDATRDAPALAHALADHLRQRIGVRLETQVLAPGTLPRYELKTKHVFDHRAAEERPSITLGRR